MQSEMNPYQPPQPVVKDEVATLSSTPVLLVVFFAVISFGIYQPIWYWRRRKALNRMAPEKGINGLCIAAFALIGISFVSGFFVGVEATATSPAVDFLFRLINLSYSILVLVLAFRVKGILEMNYPDSISGLGVFFLNFFYLQYKINRLGQEKPQTLGLGLT